MRDNFTFGGKGRKGKSKVEAEHQHKLQAIRAEVIEEEEQESEILKKLDTIFEFFVEAKEKNNTSAMKLRSTNMLQTFEEYDDLLARQIQQLKDKEAEIRESLKGNHVKTREALAIQLEDLIPHLQTKEKKRKENRENRDAFLVIVNE
jgi:hypothetical protein